jgi:hypothetical protein
MKIFDFFQKGNTSQFPALAQSPIKNHYFFRTTQWDWLDEKSIQVFDNHAPRIVKLDGWLQLIYLEANGQQTISEFLSKMAGMYHEKEPMPANLDEMILSHVKALTEDRLMQTSSGKSTLPYYFDLPKSQQDKDYALKLMKVDGFIGQ